jgi:hypothetical protein
MPLSKITNPFLDQAGAARSNVSSPSANTIAITTATAERLRVDSSGIVAMGTTDTSNTTRLKVQGGTTAVRATSAQLTIQRNTISTEYEGICLNSGPANAAYIGRVPNSDDIIFGFDAGGSLTERVRIDASGRMTKASQPAFYAYSSSTSMSSGTKAPFNAAPLNVGSCFNTSTNTFTAPIAGNYLFAAIVRYDQTGVLYAQTNLMINGLIVYQGHYNNVTNSNTTYNSVPAVALLGLAAGDTVHVRGDISGGSTFNFSGTESLFYGYLLG